MGSSARFAARKTSSIATNTGRSTTRPGLKSSLVWGRSATCVTTSLISAAQSSSRLPDTSNANGDFPFVVAEFLPQRLFEVIRADDATTAQKISYVLQLLSALAYLASLNPRVVHRDIKPQNVFVKGRSCVLGDFGLMKLVDGSVEPDREIFKESVAPGCRFSIGRQI